MGACAPQAYHSLLI